MKVAILGRGKTGSKVASVCEEQGISHTVFHSENKPSVEALKLHDVIISFFPGTVLMEYLDMIKEAKVSIISGSTGVEWPAELKDYLLKENMTWVQGHNFSLGMNLVHKIIQVMSEAPKLFGDTFKAHIHEVHHTKKLDAPSGTAIKWREWSGLQANMDEITSERTGDVVGYHRLDLKGPSETISLIHEAHDRKVFAEGAVWAAKKIMNKEIEPGYFWFEDIALKELL